MLAKRVLSVVGRFSSIVRRLEGNVRFGGLAGIGGMMEVGTKML